MYRLNPTDSSDPSKRHLPQPLNPREKLLASGPDQLNERELFCLILGRGNPGTPVEEMASELEQLYFDSTQKDRPGLEELLTLKGLGMAKASSVVAAVELGRRTTLWRGRPLHRPEDALAHLAWMQDLEKEHFQALYLDSRRRLIRSETISVGTLDASLVHPREVFRPAIRHSAAAVLVAHNHPSGDPEPSAEDMALTSRLDRAGRLLGLPLIDHLVLGKGEWVSLRERQVAGRSTVQMFAA